MRQRGVRGHRSQRVMGHQKSHAGLPMLTRTHESVKFNCSVLRTRASSPSLVPGRTGNVGTNWHLFLILLMPPDKAFCLRPLSYHLGGDGLASFAEGDNGLPLKDPRSSVFIQIRRCRVREATEERGSWAGPDRLHDYSSESPLPVSCDHSR